MSGKKGWLVVAAVFLAAVSASYFLARKAALTQQVQPGVSRQPEERPAETEDFMFMKMFYPEDDTLVIVERRIPRRTKQTPIAEAVVDEYLKGPGDGKNSPVPRNVKLLGIYWDQDRMLYLDLSDEIRRDFQGDALAEYLLVKGLYDSLMANLQELTDVKVLVDGKEIESLGGHFYLKYPLKNMFLYEFKGERKSGGE